jgi:tetratricopeptide (TPR) repeat protein
MNTRNINMPKTALLAVIIAAALLCNGCAIKQKVYAPPPQQHPAATAPETQPEIPATTEEPSLSEPPPVSTPPPPSTYIPHAGPAIALYTDAEKALQGGQLEKSEMLLERALRIEPRNAHYWYTMARIKYEQGQYGQAIQFCLKSNSLAAGLPELTNLNNRLITQAKGRK